MLKEIFVNSFRNLKKKRTIMYFFSRRPNMFVGADINDLMFLNVLSVIFQDVGKLVSVC